MAVRTRVTQLEIARRHKGLGTVALSNAIGVRHPYLSNIEARNIKASERFRCLAAEVLGVPERVLFDEDGWAI